MIKEEGAKQAAHSDAYFKKKELKKYVPELMPRDEWDAMQSNWDDKTRVKFMATLPNSCTYSELKDALYARGFKKPS